MFYAKTNFCRNKIIDAMLRAQALGVPATWYVGILDCTNGIVARSTAYAAGNTVIVMSADGTNHLYSCTTAGSTAASVPAYPGLSGEAITDGTAVFTEQTAALEAGTAQVEPSGGSYARVAITAGLTEFAGTQGPGTTVASTGTTGTTSNNAQANFPTSTAAWSVAPGSAWAYALYDAATAGNCWYWGAMTNPNPIGSGVQAYFAAGQMQLTEQ